MLRGQGLTLEKTLPLPDHADFSYVFNSYSGCKYEGYTLICTIKDAVKLWQIRSEALAVPLEFEPEPVFFAAFDALLKPFIRT